MFPAVIVGPRRTSFWLFVASSLLFTQSTFAQILAFPGALGYGAYATGARNGSVYHVVNLNDSGAGSFRDAVSHSGRTVVFDVGGHVTLASAVAVSGNTTIAGQTAPGGICFDGAEVSFSPRANIICRYLRVRPGSLANTGDDCISLYQSTNVILDHCSLEFGPWNNIDAVTANNISVQHCIDANPIYQQFGAHTENVGAFYSWQYNIFANSHNRNPLAKINDTFINNVDYNCNAGFTTHTSTRFKHDIVNNYFVAGPAFGGSGDFPWYQIDKNQSIYYSGNLFDGNDNGTLDGSITTPYWYQGVGTILSSPWSSWTTVIPTLPTPLAWRYDVCTAGAFPRDDVDSLVISQTKTIGSGTTGTGAGTTGPGTGLYTSQTQTGLGNNGYGSITGGTAPANTSGDGMADYWKLANNLSTGIAYPLTNTADGYTLLEHYLNFLAGPHGVTQTNTPVDINLTQFTAGFTSPTFSLTNSTNGTVTLTGGNTAHFVPTANFNGLGVFTFNVSESGYTLSAVVTVCVTPVAPPASATSFGGALVIVATNSVATVIAPPANLTWKGDGSANVWNTSVSNWLNGAATSLFRNGDVVSFDDTGSTSPAINLSASVTPGAILFNNNQGYTLSGSGNWTGGGAFSKSGNGSILVNTVNSGFSGTIALNAGSLVLGSGANVGTSKLTMHAGTILGLSVNNTITVANPIFIPAGESATITNVGIGNSFSGAFTSGDTASTLNLNSSMSFSVTDTSQFGGFTGTINISSGSSLRFVATSNTIGSLNPNWVINGTMQPRNAGNVIQLGSISGSGQMTGPQTASTGTGNTSYTIGGNNQSSTFTGNIVSNVNSAGSLICLNKVGTGTLTLSGTHTFGGTNGIVGGSLIINGSIMPSLATVFSGATLGGTGTIFGPVSVKTGGNLSPGTTVGNIGTLTISNNLTLAASDNLYFDLTASPAGNNDQILLPNGQLNLSNPQNVNFNLVDNALGAGMYYLITGGTNTSASGVGFNINLPGTTRQTFAMERPSSGNGQCYVRLTVTGAAANLIWSGTNGGNWDTATVNWANAANPDTYFNLDTVTFDDSGANPSGVSLVGTLTPAKISVNSSQDYTLGGAGALSGTGPLVKTGSSTLTLGTANSAYTGNILLSGGTLSASVPSALGTGSLTISNGATLSLPASGLVTFGGSVIIPANQSATISSAATSNLLSGNLYSGNGSSALNLAGSVSFSGTTSTQLDNFAGTITVQPGASMTYAAAGSGNTCGSFTPTLAINGTVQPRNAGNTIQLGAITGSGTLAGAQTATGSGDTIYVIGGNNSNSSFSGVISSNSAVAGSDVDINKVGTGTLTLSGNSTYGGGTTVSAGTLKVINTTGSATGTGDLEIFSGATLTGQGIIGSGTTMDNGATLAPGNPGGTLTVSNNLTLNDNSLLQFGLGTNSDRVVVSGSLFLTGQLTISDAGGFGPGTYTLFTCAGSLTFDNLVLVSAPAGYNYTIDTATPGTVKLIVTAPAPYFGGVNLTGNSLTLSGSNGTPGNHYYVLQSSNLTTWTSIATNQFDSYGGFSFTTNAPAASGQNFYRLQLQ